MSRFALICAVSRHSVRALVLVVFTGAGCALGPDYTRPTVEAPTSYRFASDDQAAAPAGNAWDRMS